MRTALLTGFVLLSTNAQAVTYRNNAQTTVVAPFGIPSRQPPAPGRVIQIPAISIGLSAQQVCGYTDWSTLQLELPKKLLSKQFWSRIGKTLEDQAKQTVIDLSHALPSMLACNVSPTFCHVFNQAELMASFEGELSLETCKIVDGLAVNSVINDDLRQCIGSWTANGYTASEAREKCLTNGVKSARNPKDKANAIKEAREQGEESHRADKFDLNKFIDDLFPESIETTMGTYRFNSAGHVYSRRERSASFMRELFPGIEVRGSATVRNGGTFQPSVDNGLNRETDDIKREIYLILKEMKSWKDKGYSGQDVITKSSHLFADKDKWKANKRPSAIYRPTIDGSEPTEIVTPEQIYSLLPLAGDSIDNNKMLAQVIDRISQSAAYVKTLDMLYDIHAGALTDCESPKNRGAVAQENCRHIIASSKAAMEALEHKMVAEERVKRVQDEISDLVMGYQAARASRMTSDPRSNYDLRPDTRAIPLPNSGG